MMFVPPLKESELSPEMSDYFSFFRGPLGVIPNSILTMARRPAIAKAYTALNMAVMECSGAVTPEFKRLIGYISSYASGCRYCQAHMILASERFGASEERLNDVWNFEASAHFSDAEKTALAYAHAAASTPNGVTEELVKDLKKFWSDEDIVEITAVVALFGYLNRWNDSMGTALEDLPYDTANKRLDKTGWVAGKHREPDPSY